VCVCCVYMYACVMCAYVCNNERVCTCECVFVCVCECKLRKWSAHGPPVAGTVVDVEPFKVKGGKNILFLVKRKIFASSQVNERSLFKPSVVVLDHREATNTVLTSKEYCSFISIKNIFFATIILLFCVPKKCVQIKEDW
jgi:hypothetical protein